MSVRTLRFLALLLTALTLGLAFCHVMELPGKLRLAGPDWLTVQHNLYIAFGPPIGAGIEVGAIALTWLTALLVHHRRPAFAWTLAAAVSITAALVAWGLVVAPANTVINAWTATTLPPDWTAWRWRWELGHALHAVLLALAFTTLSASILAETPGTRARNAPP